MDKKEYHRRTKSSIKHCAYPKKWVKRSNPNLRPKRYCRTPSKPDAMRKSACVDAGGAWIKRKKAGLKRKQGYCRMTAAEKAEAAAERRGVGEAYCRCCTGAVDRCGDSEAAVCRASQAAG